VRSGRLLDQILDKTDGVPLFVEELTKSILRGLDKVRGEWSLVTMAWNACAERRAFAFGRDQAVRHGFERRRVLRCWRCRGKALVQGRVMRCVAEREQRLDPAAVQAATI
jgi:hypothetical protein